MGAEPDVDVDTIQLEALDFALDCRVVITKPLMLGKHVMLLPRLEKCGALAVGVISCSRCSATSCVCEAHRAELMKDQKIVCSRCRTEESGAVLFDFLPLAGV